MSDRQSDLELKTSDLAKRLDIAESTVRKYAQELEKSGYVFRRDDSGARIYCQHDYDSFLLLKEIREQTKTGLDQAALIVVERNRSTARAAAPEIAQIPETPEPSGAAPSEDYVLRELRETLMQFAATQEMIVNELQASRERESELMRELKELKDQLDDRKFDERMELMSQLLEERKKKKPFRLF